MLNAADFRPLAGEGVGFSALLGLLGALTLAGLGAAHYMDVNGHWVTGMNNHVVWGLPHVFAVFLIVAASGSLNVASLASVFGRAHYAPLARVSAALAVCLLLGGLAVLVLDLGRPERLVVAMTHFNFRSVFTWNVFLYTGFVAVVLLYMWTMMDAHVGRWRGRAGLLALGWRFVLTSGTGFIFGLLVARDGYDAALMAPLFVALSLSAGLAVFLLVTLTACRLAARPVAEAEVLALGRLLAQLVLLTLYLVVVMRIANGYVREHDGFELFLLSRGGGYTTLYWIGYVLFGSLVPVLMLYSPLGRAPGLVLAAAALVAVGAFAFLYVLIIAVQAWPMDLLPGYVVVASSFMDGAVAPYAPSVPEWLLGVGGTAFALLLFVLAARVFRLLPAPTT